MNDKKRVFIKEGLTRQVIKGNVKPQASSVSRPTQPPPAPKPPASEGSKKS